MDQSKLSEFATRYTAAWCSQNAASVASFFAEDGSLKINEGTPSIGRAAITVAAQEFMTTFPDMVVKMDRLDVNDSHATFHWTLIGTNTGPGGGGKAVRISGYEEWRFGADGLIAESRGHFDEAEYERQLKPDDAAPNVQQAVPFLGVTDITASLAFYVDGLGFTLANHWSPEGRIRWCWLQLGGAALMLQEYWRDGRPAGAPEGTLGQGVSICFMCADALAIYHAVTARGIQAAKPFVGNGAWASTRKSSISHEPTTLVEFRLDEADGGTALTIWDAVINRLKSFVEDEP